MKLRPKISDKKYLLTVTYNNTEPRISRSRVIIRKNMPRKLLRRVIDAKDFSMLVIPSKQRTYVIEPFDLLPTWRMQNRQEDWINQNGGRLCRILLSP